MSPPDRLARVLIRAAAHRWPADLADELRDEWLAELGALPPRRRLPFAASLALSPAVDEPPWAATAGRAAAVAVGVTLLAGALVNAAHLVGGPALLALGCAGMAALGARVRMPATGTVLLLGAAIFGFLFVGNDVAVLPFMGLRDVAPAVLLWITLMVITVRTSRRPTTAAAGGLLAVAAAVAAGNWQSITAAARPASDLLLANAAASAGPMLLCTVFALAVALRGSRVTPIEQETVTPARQRIMAGVVAALSGLALAEVLRHTTPQALDNAAVFGFGFLAHPAGRAGLALLVALLAVRALDARAAVR